MTQADGVDTTQRADSTLTNVIEFRARPYEMHELPDRVDRDLAETADAEISALDQLWNLLHGRRGH